MQAIEWQKQKLILLNQTLLPNKVEYLHCEDYRIVADAIKKLIVRGAPAIGVAAAFALVLGAQEIMTKVNNPEEFWSQLKKVAIELKKTRPTAVNLFWAIDRMLAVKNRTSAKLEDILISLEKEAQQIAQDDELINHRISEFGAALFDKPNMNVLTHCNAGALATFAQGTALGVIRKGFSNGNIARVFADETRPLLQGARLTAWELMQENIPVTLITDSMAGWVMKNKMVQAVIVGADRIALNGDTANKIGTYSVAVLAKEHNIPFYVAAPLSTFDFNIKTGDEIPIEERKAEEVTCFGGNYTAPKEVDVYNPAFDVTPNHLISAIITEAGIVRAPYEVNISKYKMNIMNE